ncbi:hypothetical protein NMY22_g4055 [Coprinellus aureogranulatus]|nr:hypothetical protein NMY22_g4055 [Coprinellus aureogranulatus]
MNTREATRWTVIDSYRQWKRKNESRTNGSTSADESGLDQFHAPEAGYQVHTFNAQAKRKAAAARGPPKKKRKVQPRTLLSSTWESPPGPLWDSQDHSCAFDSWTFVLHTLWSTDKPRWSRPMENYGPFFRDLIGDFEQMPIEDPEMELSSVRNSLRRRLRDTYPAHYPSGSAGVDLLTLSRHLLNVPVPRGPVSACCLTCRVNETVVGDHISRICRYSELYRWISIQHFIEANKRPVSPCQRCGRNRHLVHEFDEVLTFQVAECPDILLNSRIDIQDWGTYRLAGVIYYDANMGHFTSRAIRLDNKVYSHDGMNGGYSEYEGLLDHSLQAPSLNELRGAKASLAIYALGKILLNRKLLTGKVESGCTETPVLKREWAFHPSSAAPQSASSRTMANDLVSDTNLPTELLSIILQAYLYDEKAFSSALGLEDIVGCVRELDEARREFRATFLLVNKTMHDLAVCISWRYVIVTSQADLLALEAAAQKRSPYSASLLGDWTWRIDLKIAGWYAPSSLKRLLSRLRNLKVIVVQNDPFGQEMGSRCRPDTLVDTLASSCKTLVRIQFQSLGEEPTVRHLKTLLASLPNLRTIHIDAGYWPSQGDDDNGDALAEVHHSLQTLSIGSIERRFHSVSGLDRAGEFLKACSTCYLLPGLRNLHLQKAVPYMDTFITKYGSQLRELAYGAGNPAFAKVSPDEEHILRKCVGIERLILVATDWPSQDPISALPIHSSVSHIVIIHIPQGQPIGSKRRVMALGLNRLFHCGFPKLKKVTLVGRRCEDVRNEGSNFAIQVKCIESQGVTVEDIEL